MIKKMILVFISISLIFAIPLSFTATAERADIDSPIPKTEKANSKTVVRHKGVPKNCDKVRRLQQINSDTVGWLSVPGTGINEVVVSNNNFKNGYYGTRDFYGNYSKNGTTYADYRALFGSGYRDELARNTVIYGHSWTDNPDGILFAQLKRFKDEDFAKQNPYIFFSTETEDIAWEIFAVFDAHIHFPYILSEPPSSYSVPQLLKATRNSSIYNYDVEVGPEDKILTLSTCTFSVPGYPKLPTENDYRFAIAARMVDPSENLRSSANLTVNPNPYPPDKYSFIP